MLLIKKGLNIVMLLFTIFLFTMIAVSAETTYNETGNYNNYYRQGTGFFNENINLDEITLSSRALTNPVYTPLVTDLDNDGTNEIIVLDGSTIRLYHDSSLSIVDSFALDADNEFSNFITFDIDSDSKPEIIIAGRSTEFLYVLEYNGSEIFNQSKISFAALTRLTQSEIMIKCGKTQNCLMIYPQLIGNPSANVNVFRGIGFNSSEFGGEVSIFPDQSPRTTWCFPKIMSMAYADYDNDETDEYIFSVASHEKMFIGYVNVHDNLTAELEINITESDLFDTDETVNCIDINTGTILSSPIVFDFDSSSSNGLETVVGYMTSDDEFLMRIYNKFGNEERRHPAVLKSGGRIVSNPMLFNAFEDTGNNDYCIMGQDEEAVLHNDEIVLLCGSLTTSGLNTKEFEFDISELGNITQDYEFWGVIAHAAQHSTITTSGTNLNELINSYGVFRLDTSIPNTLIHIFENPKLDAAVIPVDVEKAGREDLLVLQQDTLWYIDDGFTNSGGNISRYIINPCLDATWKINTSVEARVQVSDINNDLVSAKAYLYFGQSFVQEIDWTANQSSGTTFTFPFTANHTVGSSILRIVGRDTGKPSENTTIDLSISVGLNGVEFGECETDSGELLEVEDELDESDIDIQGNALTTGFRTIGGTLGLSESLIYLIIMLVVAIGIWWQGTEKFPTQTFGVLIIVEVMLLIIGVKLQLIGTGILLTVILTFIIAIALWASRFFVGTPASK